jgi:S-(hydroxymethyl)glutathione dehydrogenase/alcohol dehydrogenase
VHEVGIGVTRVREGDKVVMHWRKAAGLESEPPRYILDRREITSGRVTTFSEFAICSENRLTPVPDDSDIEACALLGCGLSTAFGTLEREANLKIGESILVIGVGGLGCNLIKAAKLMGAEPIFGYDIREIKTTLAQLMGATSCQTTWPRLWTWMKLHGIDGYDVIVETSGAPDAITNGLKLLNPSGRFIMVGQPAPGEAATFLNARHMFDGEGKTIKATQGGGFTPHVDIPRYLRLKEKIRPGDTITHRMRLDDINDAIQLVREGAAGRIIVTP